MFRVIKMPPRRQHVVAGNSKVYANPEVRALAERHSFDKGEVEFFEFSRHPAQIAAEIQIFLADKPLRPFTFLASPDLNSKPISGMFYQVGLDSTLPVFDLVNHGKNRYYPDQLYNDLVGSMPTAMSAVLPKWLITFKIYPTFKQLCAEKVPLLCVSEPRNTVRLGWVFPCGSAHEKIKLSSVGIGSQTLIQPTSRHMSVAFITPSLMKARYLCFDTPDLNRLSHRNDGAYLISVQALMVYDGALQTENILGHSLLSSATPTVQVQMDVEKKKRMTLAWNETKTGLVAVRQTEQEPETNDFLSEFKVSVCAGAYANASTCANALRTADADTDIPEMDFQVGVMPEKSLEVPSHPSSDFDPNFVLEERPRETVCFDASTIDDMFERIPVRNPLVRDVFGAVELPELPDF